MKKVLVALFLLFAGCGPAIGLVPMGVSCAPTAEAAVARLVDGAPATAANREGYRVVSLRTDALRGKRYALVASCVDSTRPLRALEVSGGAVMTSRLPSVRLGDRVTVISGGEDSHVELTGHAQDNGGLSDVIRVQMPKFSEDAAAAPVIRCRVLGSDVVEVVR